MAAADVIFFQERLASKEQELGELKSAFHKYKLKQKVKYDNLKKDVYAYCRSAGQATVDEKENLALLQIKMAEMETELEEARARVENLTEELDKSQEQLKDQMTVIRSMENSLKEMSPTREPRDSKFDKKNNQLVDMDRIQQQMLYKDQRIIELNNNILEKERQILDLQEMCREQGEVADAKKQAMRLVQKKFEEMESRNRREVATETDPWFPTRERDSVRGGRAGGASRSLSPGHAVVSRAAGGSSPPPLDPQLQNGQNFPQFDDDDMLPGTSSGFQGRNLDEEISLRSKQKKRVTFDLPPSLAASSINLNEGNDVLHIQLNETIARLMDENAKLMADVEYKNNSLIEARKLLDDSEQEIAKLLRDTKNSTLKARAVAHSRIRELEESLAELNEQHLAEVNRLTAENETLRNTREWEVEQNGLLRDHIDKLREKNTKLTAELDATGILNRDLEKKLDENRDLVEGITTELCEAEELVIFLEDQKESILDDVEKMKDAIFAQDQFIDLLEADIVIYEEHVGLLRDSLGASKVDHRALLRSKAFETKLKALEQEKEQISIKSREEKLKTKALAQKVKILEDEIEKLTEQLCTRAMGAADDEEMAETCRLLEARLHESEENMKIERARFEIELAGQRVENKQRLAECDELRFKIYALENEQRRREHEQVGENRGGQDQHHQPQQTQLIQQAAVSQETEELKEKVTQQEAKISELLQNINCLETELDAVRGTNFELTDRVKEFDELERDYDDLVEKHRHTCVELVSAKETLDKLQTEAVDPRELESLLKRSTGAEEEVRLLRIELETARQHENETSTIQKELDAVKNELEREKATNQEVLQRKEPKEMAIEQVYTAKVGLLEAALAESETEKQELRLMLDRVQEMEYVKAVERKENSHRDLTVLKEQNLTLEQAVEQHKAAEEQLLAKINDLELEASLAGELSVEMGRVIQQFEKQIKEQELDMTKAEEKAHSAEMELRLHEMLNEELGRQLDDYKEKEKLHEKQAEEIEQLRNTSEVLENRIKEAQAEVEKKETELNATKKKNALLVQQIQDLEDKLTTSVQQTKEVKVELQEKKETVQQVVGELKEMKQEQGEQEIQRVVQQVQQSVPSPQDSQVTQHQHSWNWGQAGYSPPYLQPETTVSQTPTVVVPVEEVQQLHYQAENQPHQVYHYQRATVSQQEAQVYQQSAGHPYQEQQNHGHQGHSHETRVPQSSHQQSAVEQQYHGRASHHGHSHGHSHEMQPTQTVQYHPQQQQTNYQEHPGPHHEHPHSHGHHHHAFQNEQNMQEYSRNYVQNYPQQAQDQQPPTSQNHGHPGHSHSHEGNYQHQPHGEAHVRFADPVAQQEERPQKVSQSRESFVEQVQSENELLRQCVNETIQLREDMTHDVEKLLELKNELEIAVDALKGEIWTLNGQLKASILDRENLQDRVVELDTSLIEEKKKVASLDVELSEQQELIEKATRQAAEAENESNRRLAECHEMESRRVELEQAYSQLTEYYNQLQSAYNLLYAQQQGVENAGVQQSTPVDPAAVAAINTILEELSLPVIDEDIRSKLNAIQGKIREKMMEVEQLHTAVAEQHKVARALESRLEAVEEEKEANGGEQLELKERVHQLEGDLEWKQEECDSLRRQVDELQHSLNSIIVNDGDDALATSRLRTELAILAAKLATRQADVDSLFRTNAELAHTNVRLQNELDDREEVAVQGNGAPDGEEQTQILAEKVQELEKKLAEWTDSNKEIERLKNIEKILNNRILSLEDQLLEKEEQLQEMEDQLMESQGGSVDSDRLRVLEQANSAVISELEELRQERDTLRANIQIMEKDRELRKEEAKAKEQDLQAKEEEVKQYEEELDDLKTELLVMKQKLVEKEEHVQMERVQQTQSAWGDWEEKDVGEEDEEDWKAKSEQLAKQLEELNQVRNRLEATQGDQEALKLRNTELEEEMEALLVSNEKLLHNKVNKELEENVIELQNRLEKSQEEQEELKLRNTELEEELTALLENQKKEQKDDEWGEWDQKEASGDENNLREEVETLKSRLDAAQEEQEALKLRNTELEEELTFMLEANQKQAEENKEEETWGDWDEKKESEEDVKGLKNRLQSTQEEHDTLQRKYRELESEFVGWKAAHVIKIVEEQPELNQMTHELNSARVEQEALKMRNSELEEQLALLLEANQKKENEGKKDSAEEMEVLLNKQEEQKALQLRNTELEEELAALKEASQKKDEAWGDWEEKESSEDVETLKTKLGKAQQEVEEFKLRNMDLEEELADIQETNRKLQNQGKKADWQQEAKDHADEIRQLQDEIEELKSLLDSSQQPKETGDAWGDWEEKKDNSGEVTSLKEEVDELKARLDEAHQQQEDLKLRNIELEEELKLKEKSEDNWGDDWNEKSPTEDLQKQQEEIAQLKNRLDEKEQEQEDLKLRNTELEEEMEALLESNQKLLGNKGLEQEAKELQSRLDKALQEQEDLKLRNTELEEELNALLENQKKEQKGGAWGEWEQKELSGEENKLQEEVEALKSRLDASQEVQEALKLRNTELEEELAFMLEANQKKVEENKQETWGDWDEKKESGKEVEKLQQEVQALSGTVEALQQEHIILNARNVHLEKEMAKLLETKEEKEEAWGEWDEKKEDQENVTELRQELQQKEDKIKEILEEVNDAKEELEEKDKMIQELQEQLSKAPEKKEENWGEWGEDGGELEQLKVENEELRSRLDDLEKSENEARHQLQKALKATKTKKDYSHEQNEVEKLKYELEERDRERSKLEAVIMRVEKENEDLMGQLEGGHVEEKRRTEDDMAYTLFEFQKEIQRLREENSRLQMTATQNVQSSAEEASSSEDLSQKHKEELEEAQNKLSALTTTLESVENNYLASREEAQRRQVDLEERIRSLEEELGTAQSGAEELTVKAEKLATLEKRLTEVEKQNNLLKESEGRLLESVDEYGALADKNQEEVDRLQKVVNSLEKERAQLLEELERLRAEIAALKVSSQPIDENPALKKELEVLKTERDSLKLKLTAMEGKLAEIEKEKSQIKNSYDQLRAKIQARRAAAGGGSAVSSRAPSRASVASEIREDPVELAYHQPVQTLHIQGNSYSQDIDDRIHQFVEEVKEFMSRIDSIAATSQMNLEEVDKNLDLFISRNGPRREEISLSSSPTTEIAIQTEEEPLTHDPRQMEELEKTVQVLKEQLEEQKLELEEAARKYQEFAARVDENDILSQTAINDLADCNRLLQGQLHDSQLESDRMKSELREKYEELETIAVENERLQLATLRGLEENRDLSARLGVTQTELQTRLFQVQELEDRLARVETTALQGVPIPVPTEVDDHEEEVKKTLLETIDKLETDLEEEEMEKEVVLEEWEKLKKSLEDSQQELTDVRMRNIQLEEELHHLGQDIVPKVAVNVLKDELDMATRAEEALKLKYVQLEIELSALMAAKELENGQLRGKEEKIVELETELLLMQQKLIEKEEQVQVERVQQTQEAWRDWEEKDEGEQEENWKAKAEQLAMKLEELNQIRRRLEAAQDDQEALKLRNTELEEELAILLEANQKKAEEHREETWGDWEKTKEETENAQRWPISEAPEVDDHEEAVKQTLLSIIDKLETELTEEEMEKEVVFEEWDKLKKALEESQQELIDVRMRNLQLEEELYRLEAAQREQMELTLRNVNLEEELIQVREITSRLEEEKLDEEMQQRQWIERLQVEMKELVEHLEKTKKEQEELLLENNRLTEEVTRERNIQEEVKMEQYHKFIQLQRELSELVGLLTKSQQEQEELAQRNIILEETIAELQEERNEWEEKEVNFQDLDQSIGELEELRSRLALLEEELTTREIQESENTEKFQRFIQLQKELAELLELLERSRQEQEELSLRNILLEEEVANLRRTQEEKWNDWEQDEKVEDFKGLEQSIGELEQLRSRLAQLEEELLFVTQEKTKTEANGEGGQIELLTEELEELKQKNLGLEEKVGSQQEELLELTRSLDEAQKDQEILSKKNAQLEEELEERRGAYSEQIDKTETIEKKLMEIKNEAKLKKEQLERKEEEIEELEAKLWELEDKIRALAPLEGKNTRLSDELASAQAELATLSVKIRELEMEKSRVNAEQVQKSAADDESSDIIEALEKENEQLEGRLLELSEILKKERGEAKQKTLELEEVREERESLRCQVDSLNQKIQQLSSDQGELQEKEAQIQSLQGELTTIRQEISKSIDKIAFLEANTTKLEQEKEKIIGENIRKMEEKALEVETANQRVSQLVKELEESQKEAEGLRSQLNNLTEEKDQLNAEKKNLLQGKETNLQELQEEINRVREELSGRILQLEEQILQLEAEKEKILEANATAIEGKAGEFQEAEAVLNQQAAEWRQRFEMAYADLCQLHSALQQAQEHVSHLMAQNTELQQQLEQRKTATVEEEQSETSTVVQLHPVESAPAILQLEETVQAGEITRESTAEMRISMEENEEPSTAAENEEVEEEDTRPLLAEFDDFIGQASNSRFVRAGAPITQPLIRQIRSIWGRRAFRPYFRYLLSLYFVFVHFLVFSSWFNPC